MTEQEKLEINMAAADVAGYKPCQDEYITYISNFPQEGDETIFDIFTNASQCLEVVKKLGLDYSITIAPYLEGARPNKKWLVLDESVSRKFETYEEAVGAACEEVMK